MHYNTEEKNFKKLKTQFFLRLHNRGLKKYTLTKLFSKITCAQRNELLKKDPPLSNICESVNFQEAERRIILDGERALASSQEDHGVAATSVPTALHVLNNLTNTNSMTATHLDSMAETSGHSRITSPEGWNLVFSPPWLSHSKYPQKY